MDTEEAVTSCESDDNSIDCNVVSSISETGSHVSSSTASGNSLSQPTAVYYNASKCKTKSNPPPIGKRSCRGGSASDPKGIYRAIA